MVAALNAGGNFNKLASSSGLTVSLTKPFSREGSESLPSEAVKQLFDAKPGFSIGAADTNNYTVARLKQIITAKPSASTEKLVATRKKLTESIRSDLLSQLSKALQQRYPVTINTAAINDLY